MELIASAPQTGVLSSTISVRTSHPRQFIDITDIVLQRIEAAGLREGLAVIASRHTTAAIVVNEHEPELLKDLDRLLAGLAPEEAEYGHNQLPCVEGERPNAHAHCQALLLTTSASIPIADGRLALGRYQRIFLVELDCPRSRQVTLLLLGM